MNYEEEQSVELEALESIYCDDMKILETTPQRKFQIMIKTSDCDEKEGLSCSLVFTYTPKYPDELPLIEVEESEDLQGIDLQELIQYLHEQGNQYLGMVMVFTLVSAGQEWLNEKMDKLKRDKEEGEKARLRLIEEAEMKRFEGTRVTVETFLAWRNQFEVEMGIAARREKDLRENKKLTGRELFLRDTTLNQSDLKFLDDGDAVKVDESLFQELDDLDLDDDDDEDDKDYVPGDSD